MNKQSKSTVVLIIIFLAGLGLLLYPSVSDYWNSFHSSRAIADYTEQVAQLDYAQYEQLWTAAQRFNQQLAQRPFLLMLSDEEKEAYNRQLNVSGSGMMGSIEIPSIKCTLPIYHGTEEAVLQAAVGHLEGTSLPVGGPSTHCVLSGHRALPSARLFTDLDKLVEGDLFLLHILDETLTYEVDQILIVEPGEVAALAIEPGAGLLHAGHLHALWHQYAPHAGAGPSGRKSVRRLCAGGGGRFANRAAAGGAFGGSTYFAAAALWAAAA